MSGATYKKRVAVVRGGPSTEYDVSLRSGAGVLQVLADSPYLAKDVIITKNGEWLVGGFIKSPEQALVDIDVVFIALHGSYGEDGTLQRMLERIHVPYTGSGSFASAIAINKTSTKEHLKRQGDKIKMAPHMRVTREGVSDLRQLVHSITNLFGSQYVVKPNDGGSSINTQIVDRLELYKAIEETLKLHDTLIVEQRINGREATVGILEQFRGEQFYQLPEIEIVPPSKADFFSADVKYTGETQELCPGRFSKKEKQELLDSALLAHQALGLRQYSRSDFIVANDGVYFLEVNTLPGLTSESLFPKSMHAVGSSYKELILHLLDTARVH